MKIIPSSIVVVGLFGVSGCSKGGGDERFVNKSIAGEYSTFYESGAGDPDAAMAALDRAEKADPANAYTQYLKVSALAKEGDYEGALALLEEANGMEKVVHYVKVPPPGDDMQTLMSIRQVGFSTEKAGEALGEKAPAYFEAVKRMGVRVAESEPMTSLGVINGVGVIRRTLQSEVAYWEAKEDKERLEAVQERAATFEDWQDELTENLAASLVNLMREAGKEAGLTEEELMDYAAGKDLADKGKQKKADEARLKFYEKEIQTLKDALATMPAVVDGD